MAIDRPAKMAMVSGYEQSSISCGSLIVGLVGEEDCAAAARGSRVDVGCMDSAPIAADEPWYHTTDAMQHTDLVGQEKCNSYDCMG